MRIINLEKGEAYSLRPDTKIEVERTNPFFNDYGEQTTPLDLPTSENNRRLLGFPDTFGRRVKMTPIDVSIQDGEYFSQCRQVVLSAQADGSIATSFYINDGSFYSRIQNVKLKDIFRGEYIPGVNTTEEGIAFCRRLRDNTSDEYGIFPILVADDSGMDTGLNYKVINAYGKFVTIRDKYTWVWENGGYAYKSVGELPVFYPDMSGADCDFYNAVQRTEYVNQVPITLKPGYYITPFIRANYLLRRIFAHFGYELQPNFFTLTEPFSKMVVVNNVIDVLVNGKIKVADLVPDVTCADFISVFRKKFCCEFTSDEGRRTAEVIFLRDALAAPPAEDLTKSMTSDPVISYKAEKDYQRITIASADKVDSDVSESYDDLKAMAMANPAAYFDPVDGAFYKEGWSGNYAVTTKIGEASQDYNTGEDLEPKEVKVPDLMPEFRTLMNKGMFENTEVTSNIGTFLFTGTYISLNSKMVVAGEDKEADAESASKQKPMLAFNYLSYGRPYGTISSHDIYHIGLSKPRIFDYALYYNGPDGIFERFYRDYDLLLRNSLHETKIKLLLSQSQKQNLPAYAKVVIKGVTFFFDKLKFVLGGKNEPVESELRTVALMEPIISAPVITDQLTAMNARYKWVGHEQQTEVSGEEYENSGPNKDRTFVTVYPPIPSAEWVGREYGRQSSFTSQKIKHATFWRHSKWKFTRTDVWLECISSS